MRRLAEAAKRASVEGGVAAAARAAVPALVRGTPFENRWQVNGDYRRDRLNVYIIRWTGASSPGLAPFRDNCSAAARWSVIVCDEALLEHFLERRGVFTGLHPARVASAREAFLSWTLGHEIGHVVADDEAAHFQPASLDERIARGSKSHRRELAADAFVLRQLEGDAERRLAVENLALDLLNSEIRAEVGPANVPYAAGVIFDYNNEHVVRYLQRGTHPEHFVRAARILEAAGALPGNESLREMIRPLIAQIGGQP